MGWREDTSTDKVCTACIQIEEPEGFISFVAWIDGQRVNTHFFHFSHIQRQTSYWVVQHQLLLAQTHAWLNKHLTHTSLNHNAPPNTHMNAQNHIFTSGRDCRWCDKDNNRWSEKCTFLIKCISFTDSSRINFQPVDQESYNHMLSVCAPPVSCKSFLYCLLFTYTHKGYR